MEKNVKICAIAIGLILANTQLFAVDKPSIPAHLSGYASFEESEIVKGYS